VVGSESGRGIGSSPTNANPTQATEGAEEVTNTVASAAERPCRLCSRRWAAASAASAFASTAGAPRA
jgi:hypothetical protein